MLTRLRPHSYRGLFRSLDTYLKYQVVTKLVTAAVVAPVMGLATAALVQLDGQSVVTQATLVPFLLSWRGAGFAAVLAVMFLAGFVLELNGFITISAREVYGRPEARYRDILKLGLKRTLNLVGLALPVIVFYMAVIVPLTGAGTTIDGLVGVQIPNFVMSVINGSPSLLIGYLALLAFLAVLGFLLSFTFHFVVLADKVVTRAMVSSVALVWRHKRRYLRLLGEAGVAALIGLLITLGWLSFIFWLIVTVGVDSTWHRIGFIALWLVQQSVVGIVTLLLAPAQIHGLTRTFYDCVADDDAFRHLTDAVPDLPAKTEPSLLDRIFGRGWGVLGVWLAAVLVLAVPGGILANTFLRNPEPVEVIGHRAGGFGTPENSFSGLAFAEANGVWAVEIDVQRTSDGVYILNHDETFRRAAGDSRRASEMTAAEVAGLDIDPDPEVVEPVPTLEEFLEAAKGNTTVLIEMKGSTADERMADDIIAMIERLGMRDEAIVISLKYDLIRHIERVHPATQTGYLYFLAIGSVESLDGDYLILEEGEATTGRLVEISDAGKRAIVWTVNERSSMQYFAGKPVFGIITDEIVELDAVLRQRGDGGDAELFAQLFLGPVW